MKDVFKYLKDSRELLEARQQSAAKIAADKAGYTWHKKSVWLDPKTGKKYKFDNNRFVDYDLPDRKAKSPGAQAAEPENNRVYSDFIKDTPKPEQPQQEIPSVANQMARYVPGGPDESAFESGDIEVIAKKLERDIYGIVTPEQHKEYLVRAQQELDIYNQEKQQIAAQAEAEAAAELGSEQEAEAQAKADEHNKLVKDAGEPEKTESDFRTIDKVVVDNLEENGQNFDRSITQGDVDIATEESIQRVTDISNTDVEDQRFDDGRESQKEFLDYYSKDSENREGLDTLNSIAKSQEKVGQLMKAIDAKDYLAEIEITKGNNKTVSQILLDAGIDVKDKTQLECFKNAHKEINNFVDGKGKFKTSESSELTGSNLGHYEAKHIEQRKDLLTMDPPGVQTKAYNLRNDAESNMQCVTPVITDAVYNLLPTPARDELAKSGSPKKYYDPREKNRQGKPNRIRGSAALHMWIMQDGKDAYAAAGRRRSPGEFQVEHITPLKSGGKDEIENFSMLLKRVNEPRADLSFEKFIVQAVSKALDLESDLSNPKTRAKFEKKYRSSRYNDNLGPVMGGAVSSLVSDDLMKNVNQTLDENLSEKAASKLKVKPEDFKNYQQEVRGFLAQQGLDENTKVIDMTADQMNGIFDIMTQNLGVDKSKMVEYMGRNTFNNYDVGGRTVIDKETRELERGRGGTQSSSGNLTTMQNSIMTDDSFEPREKKKIQQKINENHQQLKSARNNYIDNPNDPQAFEDYLGSMLNNVGYLTGDGDSPLSPDRKYDTRLTPSEKNTLDDDVLKGIIGMMTVDKGSLEKDKDVFSPGRQKEMTPKAKEHAKALRKKMVDAASRSTGLTPEQIENPDSLKAGDKDKLTTLTNALENIDRGLAL